MKKYDSSNIKVYEGLDAVRKRPGMYIGNTDDGSGLHRLVFEVIDNSVDEVLSGYCNIIKVVIRNNGFVSIFDNGRGIPIDFYFNENKSSAEVIMTTLHSGAKFDEESYKMSGGLHGVGVSVVNALSKKLKLCIFRSGFFYEQIYFRGYPIFDLKIVSHSDKRGTELIFFPDDKIFLFTDFSYSILLFRLKELSYLNFNLFFYLLDFRSNKFKYNILLSSGGLKFFVYSLNKNKKLINNDVIYFFGKFKDISFKIAFQWVNSFNEKILSYTNNIYQKFGGTHILGFKNSIIKSLKFYLDNSFLEKSFLSIHSDDIKAGLVAVISLYMKDPKFSSQIKDKLVSFEAKKIIEFILYKKFKKFLYENPDIAKQILDKIFLSAKTREIIKKTKDISLNKIYSENSFLSLKLSECQELNPIQSELFLVEGDSAGGSVKQARDRKFQAILPLKGKILNVEKADFEKITLNTEICSLINALNCGIGKDNYNEDKLRYHKVILMTDADVDGAHIRTLLMTFFYKYMPKLIENNHVFISKPPLYKFFKNDNNFFYINSKKDLDEFIFNSIFFEIVKFNRIDLILLKNILNDYRNFLIFIEKFLSKYPLFFLDKLIYFDYDFLKFDDLSYNFALVEFNKFFKLFNNVDNLCFFSEYFIDKKCFKFFTKTFGFLREYYINIDFFLSDDYKNVLELKKNLKIFFNKYDFIYFNNSKYCFYDFNNLINDIIQKTISSYSIQRYKGLGEMNPSQLWETSMNPLTRSLYLVNIKDFDLAQSLFLDLMGNNIENRKRLIYKNAYMFSDFDF